MSDNFDISLTNKKVLAHDQVCQYEALLTCFYHSFIAYNYLTELLSIAIRHLPEDTPASTLGDLTDEFNKCADIAMQAQQDWTETYFSMVESETDPLINCEFFLGGYEMIKDDAQKNTGIIWLRISELFDVAQHDNIITELDDSISSQSLADQYDLVLTGQYPTMPQNIQDVIADLKLQANLESFVVSEE